MPTDRIELLKLYNVLWEIRRRDIVDDFYEYCKYMDEDFFTPGKEHLQLIAGVYQYVAEGMIKKVLLSLPPRGGKSYITSLFCSWLLGRDPTGSVMRNSYSGELALKFSYDIRQIVNSPKFQRVFPGVYLKRDKKALDDWALEQAKQSSYFCAGVQGSLTGKGCNLVAILDDPIKNMGVALSELQLEKVWQWRDSVHLTRLEKDCPEIDIATRWSKRDPIGRIKDLYGAISFDLFLENPEIYKDRIVEIIIPALDQEDKSFCEEIKTTEQYHDIRMRSDSFVWDALYMQQPIDIKGLAFPQSELQFFDDEEYNKYENSLNDSWEGIIGYTDTADKGGDWLASVTGRLKGEFVYITDVVYTLEPIEYSEPRVAQMIIETGSSIHTIESNAGGRSFARAIREMLRGKSRCQVKEIANTTAKDTRMIMKGGQIRKFFKFRKNRIPGSDYDRYFKALTNYVILSQKRDDAADATVGLAESIFDRIKLEAVTRL